MPAVRPVSNGACCGKTPNSPSTPGAVNCSTGSASFTPSGVTISSLSVEATFVSNDGSGRRALHALAVFLRFFDVAAHVEGLLGQVVERPGQDLLEPGDRFLERHVFSGAAGELSRHEERLRQEALDLAGARHAELVVLAELVHAENRNDVLEILVALQRALHG